MTLHYTSDLGNPILRQQIAQLYTTLTENNVLLTTSMEGVFMAISVLVPYLKRWVFVLFFTYLILMITDG
jgi:aspartate/methionine/tyrosine aminotransferase